jgi:hypothetical protein
MRLPALNFFKAPAAALSYSIRPWNFRTITAAASSISCARPSARWTHDRAQRLP